MDCKKAFASDFADNAVHLDDMGLRFCLHELQKILIAPPYAAASVYFELRLLIPRTIFHLPWKVDVPDVKELGVYIVVKGLLAAHKLIYMIKIDLMERLTILYQRGDDGIDPCNRSFIRQDSSTGF